jgi:hypothetical protein
VSLKALADAVLARNPSRDACATEEKKPRNFSPQKVAQLRNPLTNTTAAGNEAVVAPGDELETLVRKAAHFYACPTDEIELMLEVACNDPDAALVCYRDVAADIDPPYTPPCTRIRFSVQLQSRRGQKVESMLDNNPQLTHTLVSDTKAEGNDVILTLGIRDLGTCELAIPKAKYDPFLIMRLLDEHDGTMQ